VGVIQGENAMKNNFDYGGQPCAGVALRSKLRVGGYEDADAYKNAFYKIYNCEKESDACNGYRWDFYDACTNACDDQGNNPCMKICNGGDDEILNGWGHVFPTF